MTGSDTPGETWRRRPVPLVLAVLESAVGAAAAVVALGDLSLGLPVRLALLVVLAAGFVGLDAWIRAAFAGIPPARSAGRIALILVIAAVAVPLTILAPPGVGGVELITLGLGAVVLLLGLLRRDHRRLMDPTAR